MFPFEKYYIDGMKELMASVLEFVSPAALGQSSAIVRGSRAVEYIRYLGEPCARIVTAYDTLISNAMQETIKTKQTERLNILFFTTQVIKKKTQPKTMLCTLKITM
jgi:hypothetical protein